MIVDEAYMNELLKYDFVSSKKGRGYSSLLVEKKADRGQRQEEVDKDAPSGQMQNNQSDVLHAPSGVMDVRKWYE